MPARIFAERARGLARHSSSVAVMAPRVGAKSNRQAVAPPPAKPSGSPEPVPGVLRKLLANLVIYLVPFLLVTGGLLALILSTPRPDGAVPWLAVVALFMLAVFCVSLCVAIAVESEGWNIFAILALMTLIGPFLYWVSRLDGIVQYLKADDIVWSAPVLGVLAAEVAVIAVAILVTSWIHARKASFL